MKSEIEHTSTMLGSQNMKSSQRMVSVVEPYELPEGWKWCRLGELAKFERGITFPASAKEKEKNENNIPCLRTANVQENIELEDLIYVNKSFMKNNIKKLIQNNDIVFSSANSRELVGKSAFISNVSFPMTFGGFILCIRATNSNSKFLFYFLRLHFLLGRFIGKSTQTTNIANINTETLSNIIIPLPPTLAEQQRIVNRIESMFAKLDEAKERAQNVVDGFETRKAAILHKAFTGELTANWRRENGGCDDSWEEKRFDEVADIKSNLVDVAEFQDFPHIAPDNIEKKTGVLLEYHTVAEDKVKSGKHRFYAGQILYSKIRPYLSKVVVVDFDGVCSADMYPIEAKGNTRFLWYQMLSNEFLDKASNSGSRSVLPKINQKELSVIPMQICSLPEQVEIVRILDIIMEKENKAKQAAEAVLEQIDLLKKSILARAFRGEL